MFSKIRVDVATVLPKKKKEVTVMHWLTEALSHDHAKEAQGRSERVECVWEALACSPPCTNTNGDPCAR